MELTKLQNAELDSLKDRIELIEKNIENADIQLQLAQENSEDTTSIMKAIDSGLDSIDKMVGIQAESMGLSHDNVIDLIFDREYTLGVIKG